MLLTLAERKQTGSYYTSREIADFLAVLAVRRPGDRILEPCFGEGVFLEACHDRMAKHFGDSGSILGLDLNTELVEDAHTKFPYADLLAADFFAVDPVDIGRFDAVIGNPPFVRYHRFNGDQRARALTRAADADVNLSALTSAWVPFLVHATQHLADHGRLCVVAPFELTYARYARPFVSYLCDHFGAVRVLVFDEPLFPELNEAAVLLVADDWGSTTRTMEFVHARGVRDLNPERAFHVAGVPIPTATWEGDGEPANLYRLHLEARDLYLELARRSTRLGDLASLTIGYVTGDNRWFHLSADQVRHLSLSADVRLVLRKSADLAGRGLWLDGGVQAHLSDEGAHWLFAPAEPINPAARARILDGERNRVHTAYKCRVRSPWWRVPAVQPHDFVLGVFSTLGPRLVATELPATNTLLVGDLQQPVSAKQLAAAALTSFAALSAEVNGHALGGGALKLEPAEARRWSLPIGDTVPNSSLQEIHDLLTGGEPTRASALADEVFLRQGFGLHAHEIDILRQGLQTLRQARLKRRAD